MAAFGDRNLQVAGMRALQSKSSRYKTDKSYEEPALTKHGVSVLKSKMVPTDHVWMPYGGLCLPGIGQFYRELPSNLDYLTGAAGIQLSRGNLCSVENLHETCRKIRGRQFASW